jgi:hypothetical protein
MASVSGASTNLANAIKNAGSGSGSGGSGGSGSGSGSGSEKEASTEELKTEPEERYHAINRQLEKQADLLDEIDASTDRAYGKSKLKLYQQQQEAINKEIELYNSKLEEANTWLEKDKATLDAFGLDIKYDADTDEILNYDEVEAAAQAKYNAFMTTWNSLSGSQQEERQDELDAMKKWYDSFTAALSQYEETLDERYDTVIKIQEKTREALDNELTQIEYKLEIKLDMKNALREVNELSQKIAESYGDALTHGLESLKIAN